MTHLLRLPLTNIFTNLAVVNIERIVDKSRAVLVAVSGGADSVALLHMLVSAGYHCVAAHCNFHLRADESNSDEAFVRNFCDSLSVPLHVAHFDTTRFAAEEKISIEMAARRLRYDWFAQLLDSENIPVVAVAHHADDNVETFFLNLLRGTGLRGLTGMKRHAGRVVRPLLSMSRQAIENYCQIHHLSYVTDSTNLSDVYQRNRIRHRIVPEFKELNPSFLSTMRANMQHLDAVYALFMCEVEKFIARSVIEYDGQTLIPIEDLQQLPNPEPYLFEILSPQGFSGQTISAVARCIALSRWGRVFYSAQYRAVVDRYNVIVDQRSEPGTPSSVEVDSMTDEVFYPLHLRFRRFSPQPNYVVSRNPRVAHLDASKIDYPLVVRHWCRGDTFRPLGMKGFKKVSDFFVDSKMSVVEKESAWMILSAGEIVWIVGRRIDDRFKVSPSCKDILEIELIDK